MVGVEQIIAFQTFDWPTAANQFKTRQRPVDWPSAKLIDSKWRALLTRMIDSYRANFNQRKKNTRIRFILFRIHVPFLWQV